MRKKKGDSMSPFNLLKFRVLNKQTISLQDLLHHLASVGVVAAGAGVVVVAGVVAAGVVVLSVA